MKVDNATQQLALLSKAEKWVAALREGANDKVFNEHKSLLTQSFTHSFSTQPINLLSLMTQPLDTSYGPFDRTRF